MIKAKFDLNRKANYLVKAHLNVNGSEIDGVLCKIYLPERTSQKPYIIFKPSNEEFHIITQSYKGILKSKVYNSDNSLSTSYDAPTIYFVNPELHTWGTGLSESTIYGEPQNLHIVNYSAATERSEQSQITFWISRNTHLIPWAAPSNIPKHILTRKRDDMQFNILDGVDLKFGLRSNSKILENGDELRWSYQVAYTEVNCNAEDVSFIENSILPSVDDFLLIASLVSRKRTICMGWDGSDKKADTRFYRGDYAFVEDNSKDEVYGNDLIDPQHFRSFMCDCYSQFRESESKDSIRHAIYAAVPLEKDTIELSFLNMFAGLETLVSDFRRKENYEYVIPDLRTWTQLKKYLRNCIKGSVSPKLEKFQRNSIYQKMDELNRISFREAYDSFCDRYKIDVSDLWPLYGERGAAGLVDIRNRFIHGNPFPHDLMKSIVIAKEHLKYILERSLLSVLGWDIDRTKLKPTILKRNNAAIHVLQSEQEIISKYIYT